MYVCFVVRFLCGTESLVTDFIVTWILVLQKKIHFFFLHSFSHAIKGGEKNTF